MPQADSIRLFLCGDVMTGRGIDQVLPHPTDPTLHEPYIGDARSRRFRGCCPGGARGAGKRPRARLLVWLTESGVPWKWAATAQRAGVNFLEDTSKKTARRIAREMRGFNRQCDVIVASIHWGGNWGYRIRDEETCFAHQLIEHGIAVVHGHSSHHVKTAEIYSDRLALYGCGDFLNDYEGISGYEVFRSDLTLMYLPAIDPRLGQLVEVLLVPMRVARFRLIRAVGADAEWLCDLLNRWLCDLLNRLGAPLGTRGELGPDHTLTLHPSPFHINDRVESRVHAERYFAPVERRCCDSLAECEGKV